MEERDYRFWLCSIPDIGREKYKGLIEVFGSAEAVAKASEGEIGLFNEQYNRIHFDKESQIITGSRKGMLNEKNIASVIRYQKKAGYYEELLKKHEKQGIRFLLKEESAYPERLRSLVDAPEWLFVKGRIPSDLMPAVAIVGARGCSLYGSETAESLSYELALNGINVISGMACGIDAAAHRGTISYLKDKGKKGSCQRNSLLNPSCPESIEEAGTYAVLGSGVDVCYPNENAPLYYDMTHGMGGVLSEYLPGEKPVSWHFPYRNRIISGLADAVIVTEARIKSGSLITADAALEQEKPIFAVPGRITDPLSQGCNYLIYQGSGIITDIKSFIENEFGGYVHSRKDHREEQLSDRKKRILEVMSGETVHIERLAEALNMDYFEISSDLFELQEMGLIMACGLNQYRRKQADYKMP